MAPIHEAVTPARRVDVGRTLRAVPPDEADDVAHVGVIVAREIRSGLTKDGDDATPARMADALALLAVPPLPADVPAFIRGEPFGCGLMTMQSDTYHW